MRAHIAHRIISGVHHGEEFSDRTTAKGVGGVTIEVGRRNKQCWPDIAHAATSSIETRFFSSFFVDLRGRRPQRSRLIVLGAARGARLRRCRVRRCSTSSQLSTMHRPFGSQHVAARSAGAIVLITMERSSGSVESEEDSCAEVGGGAHRRRLVVGDN